jgi:DNA primase
MECINPSDIWKFRATVLSKISIIDIAIEYGINLEEKETGLFTHRAYCPLHAGKGQSGQERTPSMFFSKHSNSFCCFGCSRSGNVIDFVIYMDGAPQPIALTKLANKKGLVDVGGNWDELQINSKDCFDSCFDPNKTVDPYIFKISDLLRSYINKFKNGPNLKKEFKWMEQVSSKADSFLANIGYEDWEYAKDLSDKVEKAIKNRLRMKGE